MQWDFTSPLLSLLAAWCCGCFRKHQHVFIDLQLPENCPQLLSPTCPSSQTQRPQTGDPPGMSSIPWDLQSCQVDASYHKLCLCFTGLAISVLNNRMTALSFAFSGNIAPWQALVFSAIRLSPLFSSAKTKVRGEVAPCRGTLSLLPDPVAVAGPQLQPGLPTGSGIGLNCLLSA